MPNIQSANFQLVHTPLHRATIACNQSVNEHSLFSVAMLSARGGISAISIRITMIFSHMDHFIPQKKTFFVNVIYFAKIQFLSSISGSCRMFFNESHQIR